VNEVFSGSLLERYQRLAEISRDLASTLELDGLLKRIVQAAADLSQAEAASILLYDERKQQLYFESATNLEEPLMRGLIVPVEGSIAGWVVTHRQPIIISEAQKDPRHFGNIAKATNVTTTSMLGVPLVAKEKVIGTLEAINKQNGQFTEEDQNVLMALAAQAAVAIENARLFQQSDLIAEMVHELRTPLSSLNTAAHLLLRKDIPDTDRNRVVEIIHNEAERLTEMTTAFLDLARLESGRIQFNVQVFDLKPLLEECSDMMEGKAFENGLSLELEVQPGLPSLKADRDKIKQVLINLVSNGIKYNRPGGKILIQAGFELKQFIVNVSDTGLGINQSDLDHLFERFYRVKSTEEITSGTGLGLAICKRIVEAHGGNIEVASELGAGTTFTVFLPGKGS
jgi:signal transduction histidine kinase